MTAQGRHGAAVRLSGRHGGTSAPRCRLTGRT